jgi:putative tricarboxylic transport membrane protein
MASLFADFLSSLSLINLGLAFSGVLAGIIIGALPGLSATMAVAILVPFTFALEPSSGLIVLGAIYTGAIFGGSWLIRRLYHRYNYEKNYKVIFDLGT